MKAITNIPRMSLPLPIDQCLRQGRSKYTTRVFDRFHFSLIPRILNNMGQGTDSSRPRKHVCIFELERKGDSFTKEVVCTVCGAYPTFQNQASTEAKVTPKSES